MADFFFRLERDNDDSYMNAAWADQVQMLHNFLFLISDEVAKLAWVFVPVQPMKPGPSAIKLFAELLCIFYA